MNGVTLLLLYEICIWNFTLCCIHCHQVMERWAEFANKNFSIFCNFAFLYVLCMVSILIVQLWSHFFTFLKTKVVFLNKMLQNVHFNRHSALCNSFLTLVKPTKMQDLLKVLRMSTVNVKNLNICCFGWGIIHLLRHTIYIVIPKL